MMSDMSGKRFGRGEQSRSNYGASSRGRYKRPRHDSSHRPEQHHEDSRTAEPLSYSRYDQSWIELSKKLRSIDGAGYGAYNQLKNVFYNCNDNFKISFTHIQGDAYAQPSKVRIFIPLTVAKYPQSMLDTLIKRTAVKDFITRRAAEYVRTEAMDQSLGGSGWGGPKGGAFNINAPGQEVLERTSCLMDDENIELRVRISLPAKGRTVLGKVAAVLLTEKIPLLVKEQILYGEFNNTTAKALHDHVEAVDLQAHLRSQLETNNLVAFVANGSILPRQSGSVAMPMSQVSATPFTSPIELETVLQGLHGTGVKGMGIKKGVTVITGGCFHGKSTLLEAVQLGVYNHRAKDGRDAVVTCSSAVKIRAEDGRSVAGVDISPFIRDLPGGKDVRHFASSNASGATSMAASFQEALAMGSKLLLIDEDSSATNLLVRDQRMQALIKNEPIIGFVTKTRALFKQHGVSTVIVVGGCGDYLSVADTVIGMENYRPIDLTVASKRIVKRFPSQTALEHSYGDLPCRSLHLEPSIVSRNGRRPQAKGKTFVKLASWGSQAAQDPAEDEVGVDLTGLEQIVEPGQTCTIAEFLRWYSRRVEKAVDVAEEITKLEAQVELHGLDHLNIGGEPEGDMVATRRFELGAALARVRGVQSVKLLVN